MIALLFACTSGTPEPLVPSIGTGSSAETAAPEVGSIEVGTGEFGFEALGELQEVMVVFGPQGGYHMLGAIRVCELVAPFDFGFRIIHDGQVISESSFGGQVFIDSDGECAARWNLFGFVEVPGPSLDGEVLQFEAMILDAEGTERQDRRAITARFLP